MLVHVYLLLLVLFTIFLFHVYPLNFSLAIRSVQSWNFLKCLSRILNFIKSDSSYRRNLIFNLCSGQKKGFVGGKEEVNSPTTCPREGGVGRLAFLTNHEVHRGRTLRSNLRLPDPTFYYKNRFPWRKNHYKNKLTPQNLNGN